MANENSKKKFKFNIVDVIIIVLIICVIIFAVRYFSDNNGGATVQETMLVTFYGEEVADYVIEKTSIGDPSYDVDNNMYIGSVVDLRTDTAQTYVETLDGELVLGPKENYSSVYITVEVTGTPNDYGVIVNGIQYAVGHSVVIYGGEGKYYLKIYDVQPVA